MELPMVMIGTNWRGEGKRLCHSLLKGREVTIELNETKTLESSELFAHWNYNKENLLAYLRHALYGIKGIVTDSITGDPLVVNVKILRHDDANSVMRTNKKMWIITE